MAEARYDPGIRRFVLDDGSVIENLQVTHYDKHRDSFPVYEFGTSSAVAQIDGQTTITITVNYEEPEAFLAKDVKAWRDTVDREEIRKKSEEIVNDFRR
jgi:hypothetical protein